jgi:hypothetical protein
MPDFTDSECLDFLLSLFPGGVKDEAVISELCPEGWERSALFAGFHPGPQRRYEEHLAFRQNMRWMASLRKKKADEASAVTKGTNPEDEGECDLSFEEYLAENPPTVPDISDADRINEPAELIGLCLWDIFSDNHEVIAADGRVVNLGSFRGSGGTIADFFEQNAGEEKRANDWGSRGGYDYMRFYMGTAWVAGRADLTPVYRLIFRRIRSLGGDWRYSFPRLHLVDFGAIPDADSEVAYDPSAAFEKEQELKKRAAETARLNRELDESAKAAKREARAKEPPETVQAYVEIYGCFPAGWPPDPYAG